MAITTRDVLRLSKGQEEMYKKFFQLEKTQVPKWKTPYKALMLLKYRGIINLCEYLLSSVVPENRQ